MEESRRAFVRVSADCPILYRTIEAEDESAVEIDRFDPISSIETHSISSTLHSDSDSQESKIIELLLWIDWKVNYLIKERAWEKDKARFPNEAVMVDLSGSGMRFSSQKKEDIRTRLQFKFLLPVLPFKEMTLEAEVVHLKEKTDAKKNAHYYEVGVEFFNIKPADQEALFSYVVKRELQIRHEQREQDGKDTES